MEVARYIQSINKRKLVIFLEYILKSVAATFVFYCDTKHSDILWGPVMFIVTYLLAQPDHRNFLHEYCNNIIKLQLCLEELPSLLACSKLMFFKRSRVYCSKSNYANQTNQKKLVSRLVIQIIPPKVFTTIPL